MLVEGHGEIEAVANLLARLGTELGLPFRWRPPIRWKRLHTEAGMRRAAELVRSRSDAAAMLVLRDEDDGCPRDLGPRVALALRALALPFPSAAVLLHPEYEVLFLPCLDRMAGKEIDGRPGFAADVKWDGATWESRRGIKEWLSRQMPGDRRYKPTLDQWPLTRMIDLAVLREAGVPCFGTLERALRFLGSGAAPGDAYPTLQGD